MSSPLLELTEAAKRNDARLDEIRDRLRLSGQPISHSESFFLLSQLSDPSQGYGSVPKELKGVIRAEGVAIAVDLVGSHELPWWAWLRRRLKAALQDKLSERVRAEIEGVK